MHRAQGNECSRLTVRARATNNFREVAKEFENDRRQFVCSGPSQPRAPYHLTRQHGRSVEGRVGFSWPAPCMFQTPRRAGQVPNDGSMEALKLMPSHKCLGTDVVLSSVTE